MSDVEKVLIARGQALHAEFFLPTRSPVYIASRQSFVIIV